jgi:hypothetical protein
MPRLTRSVLPLLAILVGGMSAALAQTAGLTAYYFPEDQQCTLLVDFQPRRSELEPLGKDARSLALAKAMLKEFSAHGAEKCPGSKSVRLIAVYIPGTDTYGRPDFGSRTNLLRLEGSNEAVAQGAASDAVTTDQLVKLLNLTVY